MSKDYQKKLISQLENLKINALNKYLSTKYSSHEKTGFTCEYCNVFSASTKKSLSAHVRACKKQHEVDTPILRVELNNNSSDGGGFFVKLKLFIIMPVLHFDYNE